MCPQKTQTEPLPPTPWNVLKATFGEFASDNCMRMAAALAYYTIFSMPAFFVVMIGVAGMVIDPATLRGEISAQLTHFIGANAAKTVQNVIASAQGTRYGALPAVAGMVVLAFAATSVMAQLQDAMNTIWGAEDMRRHSRVISFIIKRALSFVMLLAIAVLLGVSLVLSTIVTNIGKIVAGYVPHGGEQALLFALNEAATLLVLTLLFAAIFKILPDVVIWWRDVWLGAFVTAVLFAAGNFGLGVYLGHSDRTSAYGAAGSLVLIMMWVYYSALILFLGGEFTQVWARQHGRKLHSPNSDDLTPPTG